MKFREHRGGLADSMETVVDVANKAALVEHVAKLFEQWPTAPQVNDQTLNIGPCEGRDSRIGWDWHYVTLEGHGIIGMTDGK